MSGPPAKLKKKKTVLVKKGSTINAGLRSGFAGILSGNAPMNNETEREMMETEEGLQRKIDRYWGIEKDNSDRQREKECMHKEDFYSSQLRTMYHRIEKQKQWDEEFYLRGLKETKVRNVEKENLMSRYMLKLHTAQTPDDVLNYVWSNGGSQTGQKNSKFNKSMVSSTLNSNSLLGPSIDSMSNSLLPNSLPKDEREVRIPTNVSIHQDGLQQSRAVMNDTMKDYHQPLKRVNNESMIEEHTTQPFDAKPEDPMKLLTSSEAEISNAALQPKHIEDVDGHPDFKWDQQMILQSTFNYLDVGQKQYLTRDDILEISRNSEIHELLKFTVLWGTIKKKQWTFYESLFTTSFFDVDAPLTVIIEGSSSAYSDGSSSSSMASSGYTTLNPIRQNSGQYNLYKVLEKRQRAEPVDKISFSEWMNAACYLGREQGVRLRHIRTMEEHLDISTRLYEGNGVITHSYATLFSSEAQRQAMLSRTIKEGDSVWALHHESVRWLPGVVERIYNVDDLGLRPNTASSPSACATAENAASSQPRLPHNGGNFLVDLWYPLNERDIVKAKTETTSRQLRTLPSQKLSMIHEPKPFKSEHLLCGYAFDLIDTMGEGYVELNQMLWSFQSEAFKLIIQTSLALTIIFGIPGMNQSSRSGSSAASGDLPTAHTQAPVPTTELPPAITSRLDPDIIPCLLPVFVDTFSAEEEEEVDDDDGDLPQPPRDLIRRSDFLEFCSAVLDVKRYSIVPQ